MPFRLRHLVIDRVDLVDKGANQRAHVTLFKRADVDVDKTEGGTPMEKFDLEQVAEDQRALVKAELDRVEAARTADVERLTAELETVKTELAKRREEGDPPRDPASVDVEKIADPELRATVEALKKHASEAADAAKQADEVAKAAQEAARVERHARLKTEKIALAKNDYGGIAVDHTRLAEALLKLDEGTVDDETRQVIADVLKAASAQIQESALFVEKGSSAPPSDDTTAGKVAKAVSDKRKANAALTKEQAEAEVYDEHPEWYAEEIASHDVQALAAQQRGA